MKSMMLALCCGLGASACSLDIIAIAPDEYLVSDPGFGSWYSSSELRSDIESRAREFCTQQGKEMVPVPLGGDDAAYAKFEHAEMRFSCVPEGQAKVGGGRSASGAPE